MHEFRTNHFNMYYNFSTLQLKKPFNFSTNIIIELVLFLPKGNDCTLMESLLDSKDYTNATGFSSQTTPPRERDIWMKSWAKQC